MTFQECITGRISSRIPGLQLQIMTYQSLCEGKGHPSSGLISSLVPYVFENPGTLYYSKHATLILLCTLFHGQALISSFTLIPIFFFFYLLLNLKYTHHTHTHPLTFLNPNSFQQPDLPAKVQMTYNCVMVQTVLGYLDFSRGLSEKVLNPKTYFFW